MKPPSPPNVNDIRRNNALKKRLLDKKDEFGIISLIKLIDFNWSANNSHISSHPPYLNISSNRNRFNVSSYST